MKLLAHHSTYILVALGLLLCTTLNSGMPQRTAEPGTQAEHACIVQAHDAAAATAAVTQAGGTVTQQLAIINGVAATLNQAAYTRLQRHPNIALHLDAPLQAAGGGEPTPPAICCILAPRLASSPCTRKRS